MVSSFSLIFQAFLVRGVLFLGDFKYFQPFEIYVLAPPPFTKNAWKIIEILKTIKIADFGMLEYVC